VAHLPAHSVFLVAVATPVTDDFRPHADLLLEHCRWLLRSGADGLTLFGTTGEGAEFAVEDRMATLDAVVAGGIDPAQIVVSIGALSIPDVVRLARHALDREVHGLLLMPPCVYRAGISEDGAFRYFDAVIEGTARADMRLYLYHFPDISGVPITPQVVRRLDQRFPAKILGVKDSGGDIDFTEALIRRFSHLSILTGTEVHLPQLLASGARGTICGLGNVMPKLIRSMMDLPTAFDRRALIPHVVAGDAILSRRPFIPSTKALIGEAAGQPAWRSVLPPMSELPLLERKRMVADFERWEAGLPAIWRSLFADAPAANTRALRRA
jgi:4-hydroxy-tetrahydrodipicolinate synthase